MVVGGGEDELDPMPVAERHELEDEAWAAAALATGASPGGAPCPLPAVGRQPHPHGPYVAEAEAAAQPEAPGVGGLERFSPVAPEPEESEGLAQVEERRPNLQEGDAVVPALLSANGAASFHQRKAPEARCHAKGVAGAGRLPRCVGGGGRRLGRGGTPCLRDRGGQGQWLARGLGLRPDQDLARPQSSAVGDAAVGVRRVAGGLGVPPHPSAATWKAQPRRTNDSSSQSRARPGSNANTSARLSPRLTRV